MGIRHVDRAHRRFNLADDKTLSPQFFIETHARKHRVFDELIILESKARDYRQPAGAIGAQQRQHPAILFAAGGAVSTGKSGEQLAAIAEVERFLQTDEVGRKCGDLRRHFCQAFFAVDFWQPDGQVPNIERQAGNFHREK